MIRVRRNRQHPSSFKVTALEFLQQYTENIWDLNAEIFMSLLFCYLKDIVHRNHRPTCRIPSASKHFTSYNQSTRTLQLTCLHNGDSHRSASLWTAPLKRSKVKHKGKCNFFSPIKEKKSLNKHCFVFICIKTHWKMNFHGRAPNRF